MKFLARLIRRLTGREVLPSEIKRVRVFRSEEKDQVNVDVVQTRPVNEIIVNFVIGDDDE